jgi:hypothetical protein
MLSQTFNVLENDSNGGEPADQAQSLKFKPQYLKNKFNLPS